MISLVPMESGPTQQAQETHEEDRKQKNREDRVAEHAFGAVLQASNLLQSLGHSA